MENATEKSIREAALDLLKKASHGLRMKDLHRGVCNHLPHLSPVIVSNGLRTLRHDLPRGYTNSKGMFSFTGME